ncbi:MAG: hypothetical protein ACI4TT_01435 [Christensenellales bacterium]
MILINGVKVNNSIEKNEQIKQSSINEILDKMQVNYNNMNYAKSNQSVDIMSSKAEAQSEQPVNTLNASDSNLLMSLLPILLNQSKENSAETLKNQQNELLHSLIKNLNNPMLEKVLELLPKLTKKSVKKVETESTKKDEPKIDSFVKTSEYDEN